MNFNRHLLIAFGGLAGLEESVEEDNQYKVKCVSMTLPHRINKVVLETSRRLTSSQKDLRLFPFLL